VAGTPTNVQFTAKDSKIYASTGGWWFAQFTNGKPEDEAVHKTCFSCHSPAKDRDIVLTRYPRRYWLHPVWYEKTAHPSEAITGKKVCREPSQNGCWREWHCRLGQKDFGRGAGAAGRPPWRARRARRRERAKELASRFPGVSDRSWQRAIPWAIIRSHETVLGEVATPLRPGRVSCHFLDPPLLFQPAFD
jgi:hypothetical protein